MKHAALVTCQHTQNSDYYKQAEDSFSFTELHKKQTERWHCQRLVRNVLVPCSLRIALSPSSKVKLILTPSGQTDGSVEGLWITSSCIPQNISEIITNRAWYHNVVKYGAVFGEWSHSASGPHWAHSRYNKATANDCTSLYLLVRGLIHAFLCTACLIHPTIPTL